MASLLDTLRMLLTQPVSYNNTQTNSYENLPQQGGGGWGFGTSSAFNAPRQRQQTPDLASLLAQQSRVNAIPTEIGPVQQPSIQQDNGPMTDEMLERALAGLNREQTRTKPSYDYGAIEQFAGPAYTEGPNTNIQDDSRARALAWLAQQNQ